MTQGERIKVEPAETVTEAHSISAAVCEHGTVFLQLHDEQRKMFAVVSMSPDIFAQIATDVFEAVDNIKKRETCEKVH